MGDWRDQAACKGMPADIFYPADGDGLDQARETCAGCEVREPCLEFAVTEPEIFGFWGGMSEKERRKLRRKMSPEQRQRRKVERAQLYRQVHG